MFLTLDAISSSFLYMECQLDYIGNTEISGPHICFT